MNPVKIYKTRPPAEKFAEKQDKNSIFAEHVVREMQRGWKGWPL